MRTHTHTLKQFTFPEIWKWHAVLVGIHAGGSNRKILQYLDVDLKTVQRIQKELDEFNGDYEGMTT